MEPSNSSHSETPVLPKIIGWREWVALPQLGVTTVKAKIDTGARTSSLHAYDLEEFEGEGGVWMRFKVHPEQRDTEYSVKGEAPLIAWRNVTPSSGHTEHRPVVVTTIQLMGESWEAELTLTRRDDMGFRMLLGRQALRARFIVDPSRSYIGGRRVKGTRRLKAQKRRGN